MNMKTVRSILAPHTLIWIVPICAAIGAGLYWKAYYEERGPVISIRFTDVGGLKVGNTPVLYRGVPIGRITDIDLSPDQREVLVQIQVRRGEQAFAQAGALFWIVRPEVSYSGIKGIGTVLSGPYIEAAPGSGKFTTEFAGSQKAPEVFEEGLNLVLYAPILEHVQPHSPVHYRGIQVGAVRDVRLGREANQIEVRIVVWKRYRALVRTNSRFWIISGFEVKGGLFSGVKLKLESLGTVISGAVGFATPEKDMGEPAKEGSEFALRAGPKKEWLEWAPRIPISPAPGETEQRVPAGERFMRSSQKR